MVLKSLRRRKKLKLKVKIEKRGNSLKKLEDHLRKLKGEIHTGYFNGEIHEDSGLTLATLMAIHENGNDHLPARPALKLGSDDFIKINNKEFKLLTNRLITQVGKIDINYNLIGQSLTNHVKLWFGDPSKLAANAPSKGRNTPLVDTEELKDNLGFRTTKNMGVQK